MGIGPWLPMARTRIEEMNSPDAGRNEGKNHNASLNFDICRVRLRKTIRGSSPGIKYSGERVSTFSI